MTTLSGRQPAIALVDDDYHSARLMTRMIEAHGGPQVLRLPDPGVAIEALADATTTPMVAGQCMAIVDLKSSSTATRDFGGVAVWRIASASAARALERMNVDVVTLLPHLELIVAIPVRTRRCIFLVSVSQSL